MIKILKIIIDSQLMGVFFGAILVFFSGLVLFSKETKQRQKEILEENRRREEEILNANKQREEEVLLERKKTKLEEFYTILYRLNYYYNHILNLIKTNHDTIPMKSVDIIYKELLTQNDRNSCQKEFNPNYTPEKLIIISKLYLPELREELEVFLVATGNLKLFLYNGPSLNVGDLFRDSDKRQLSFNKLEDKIKNYKF